jgi:hypothetical protein
VASGTYSFIRIFPVVLEFKCTDGQTDMFLSIGPMPFSEGHIIKIFILVLTDGRQGVTGSREPEVIGSDK